MIVGDCQERLPFPDGHFDRYLAIHVLKHLPNLPACLEEAWRLLDKRRGQMLVVIPCEGGLAYSLARRASAQPIFERRYRMPYRPFVENEHLNQPHETSQSSSRTSHWTRAASSRCPWCRSSRSTSASASPCVRASRRSRERNG